MFLFNTDTQLILTQRIPWRYKKKTSAESCTDKSIFLPVYLQAISCKMPVKVNLWPLGKVNN